LTRNVQEVVAKKEKRFALKGQRLILIRGLPFATPTQNKTKTQVSFGGTPALY
jgi:hypothetical protein